MIIQFCGLSGSGKTTLATATKQLLITQNVDVEIIDGDEYRRVLCADLGFSKEDRNNNIRRLAFVASRFSNHNIVAIICAINPYNDIREEIKRKYNCVKTIFIKCDMDILIQRDTKGLYKRAVLPLDHPERVDNFTGISDPFEVPLNPDLIVDTTQDTIGVSAKKIFQFIVESYM